MDKKAKAVNTDEKKSQLNALVSGVLISYAITCIAFIAVALALTHTSLQESSVPLIITIVCIVAVFIAGFDASRVAEKNGWLWGIIAGAIYVFILFCILTWVSKEFTMDVRKITLLVLSLAGGGLGGVIGINFKK